MNKITIGEKYYIHSIFVTLSLFFFYLFGINNSFLYTSIFEYRNIKSELFDGTVYPIEFVPNPFELSFEERKKNFEEIDSKYFIRTPIYNPSIFERNPDNLVFGSKEYNDTITQRLIFTVPYMGTYNFDYKEFSGSHPGVDIIAPRGTPVRNIASGIVVKVGFEGGGFGNYVLVKHNNVPLKTGELGDIYSLYAHLSKSVVTLGSKIKKGELIGYVGDTGVATTPHFHFQIELPTAPYSPYWPFSASDMKKAKVGFFDGVNMGLGRENAIKYTINPLKFVNENLSGVLLATNNDNSVIDEKKEEISSELKEESKTQTGDIINIENIEEDKNNQGVTDYKKEFTQDSNLNQDIKLSENTKIENTIQILKKEDMIKNDVEFLSTLDADLILSNFLDISLYESDKITAFLEEDLGVSLEKIDKIDDLKNPNESQSISKIQDKDLESLPDENVSESMSIKTGITNTNGIFTLSGLLFSDIKNDYKYFTELKYFKDNNFISGFSDGSFRPNSKITRIESLKIILLANKIRPIKDEPSKFLDINTNSWENTYINSALKLNIISRENNKFYPFRSISRAEGLKLILNLAGVDFSSLKNDLKFEDVKDSDWYYKYANYAVKNNLLEIKNNKFYPNSSLTREELISILYKIIKK